MQDPESAYVTDIPRFLKVLDVCVQRGVRRVVFASSGGTIYGNSSMANNESQNTLPINNYGISKVACEKILQMHNLLYGMENVVLRIANPYGAGQRVQSGVGAVTAFANSISIGEPIVIYGDGDNVRDFVAINYVAEAFYNAGPVEVFTSDQPRVQYRKRSRSHVKSRNRYYFYGVEQASEY